MSGVQYWARAVVFVTGIAWAVTSQADVRKVPFDRSVIGSIKTIDVLDVMQLQPLVLLPRSARDAVPDKPRPSIAAVAKAGAKLNEGFARRNTSLPLEFSRQLVTALRAAGYETKVFHGMPPRGGGTSAQAAGLNSTADAVLYVVLRFAGYKDDASEQAFVPLAGVDVYLFGGKDGKLIYRQVFSQGYALLNEKDVEHMPVPGMMKFPTRRALMSRTEEAARGLVQVLQPVADRIAQQLAK